MNDIKDLHASKFEESVNELRKKYPSSKFLLMVNSECTFDDVTWSIGVAGVLDYTVGTSKTIPDLHIIKTDKVKEGKCYLSPITSGELTNVIMNHRKKFSGYKHYKYSTKIEDTHRDDSKSLLPIIMATE